MRWVEVTFHNYAQPDNATIWINLDHVVHIKRYIPPSNSLAAEHTVLTLHPETDEYTNYILVKETPTQIMQRAGVLGAI